MKNTKLKSDIEGKINEKILEIVSEYKVGGSALTKSAEVASKRIAKQIIKKLQALEKKIGQVRKVKQAINKKLIAAGSVPLANVADITKNKDIGKVETIAPKLKTLRSADKRKTGLKKKTTKKSNPDKRIN